jgi:hypothetical protein
MRMDGRMAETHRLTMGCEFPHLDSLLIEERSSGLSPWVLGGEVGKREDHTDKATNET